MESKLGKIDIKDIVKGLIVSAIGAALVAFQGALTVGKVDWKEIGVVALGSGVAYLIKNIFTNSDGQPFSAEKK